MTVATDLWLDQGMSDINDPGWVPAPHKLPDHDGFFAGDEDMFDFGPEKVTVTMDPDVHASIEALLVAVARWEDSHGRSSLAYLEACDRLRWQYSQYRKALAKEVF